MSALLEFFKNLGTGKLIALIGVLGLLGGFFSFVVDRMAHAPMVLLAADLYPADAGKIVTKIESLNIPFEIKGEGSAIYVPQDHVFRLRMQLAEEGITSGSIVGNEIFDRTDTLGMTSFLQDVHQLRALEGELARTITSLKPVASARVHLVIPKKSLFTQEAQDPTASIIVRMRYGGRLNESQIQAIQHLVASAVPGLSTEAISMIDDQGTLLARGERDHESDARVRVGRLEELHVRYEERLSRSIESLLEKTLGPGKVKAKVSVDMDYDHTTENAELFDPEGQVVRSTQTSEDGTQSTEHAQQTVTVQNNLPSTQNLAGNAPRTANNSKKSDETVNYEISKTVRNRIREIGGIKRLSVAVLIDGYYSQPGDAQTYTPRPAQEVEQIKQLVSSAIGCQEERGDRVDVINMKFIIPDINQSTEHEFPLGLSKTELMRISEVLLLVLAVLLMGFFILKPFMNSLVMTFSPQLGQKSLDVKKTGALGESDPESPSEEEFVDYKIKKSNNLSRIEDIIKQNPEETISMIRNWLKGEI